MHVKYLQHSSHGTVQLLLMPLSTGFIESTSNNENKTNNSEDENESEPIPLPIQSFLWRQTNPFLGSRVNKLQDASCVTFERVIVQNILHGLSPSLSEAIASISRWNFVRTSFPHIIQCSATLMAERAEEEESLAISGSLVKMLYILHWLLIDASIECLSNELTAPSTSNCNSCINVRQLTYPISSIQLFVYLLAPLFHVIHEEEIEGHIRLESGLNLWNALWQQRLPELLCFSAPVKQRRNQFPLLNTTTMPSWTRRTQSTANDQGIYIGEKAPLTSSAFAPFVSVRRPSQIPPSSSSTYGTVIKNTQSRHQNFEELSPLTTTNPPPKPPRTDVNVLNELEIQKKNKIEIEHPSSLSSQAFGIVRSVSDYKSSVAEQQNQQKSNNLKKSRTTSNAFLSTGSIENFPTEDVSSTGIQKIDDLFHYSDDGGFSTFNLSLSGGNIAPIVKMNEICSGASIDSESVNGTNIEKQKENNITGISSSTIAPTITKSSLRTLVCNLSGDDSTSQSSQQTVVARPLQQQLIKQQKHSSITPKLSKIITKRSDSEMSTGEKSTGDSPFPSATSSLTADPHDANYLDIGVLRCLLIKNWSEKGIFWAVRYLLNRLIAMRQYRCLHEGTFRSRCNSETAANRKTSKNEIATMESQYLTWADLQQENTSKIIETNISTQVQEQQQQSPIAPKINERRKSLLGLKRTSIAEQKQKTTDIIKQKEDQQSFLLPKIDSERSRRRISANTLPIKPTKKISRTEMTAGYFSISSRSRSEPALFSRLFDTAIYGRGSLCPPSSFQTFQDKSSPQSNCPRKYSQFFPEAIGSGAFIERNGHLSILALLKTLGTLMERCSVVRVSEVVLNICDILLNMPSIEQYGAIFQNILHILHRVCLQLGCPNGCNEGSIKCQQAEFLRIKLRNLIAQMHNINSELLSELLRQKVKCTPITQMVDALHSLTIFCRASPSFNRLNQRSRVTSNNGKIQPFTKTNTAKMSPTYKNNFNESSGGIESVLMSAIFGPLLSKLTAFSAELWQPENMSFAQDVRMLIAYTFERHGNPLRRYALSAMSAKTINRIGSARSPWNEPQPQSSSAPTTVTLTTTSKNNKIINNNNTQALSLAPAREYAASLRRGLFRKREWMQTTLTKDELTGSCGADSDGGGTIHGGGDSTHSTPPPRVHPSTSMDDSSIGSPQPQIVTLVPKKGGGKGSSTNKSSGATGRLLGLLKGARHGTTSSDQTVINLGDDEGSLNATSDEQQQTTSVVEDDRESSLGGGGSLDAGSLGQGKSNIGLFTRSTPPNRLAAPKAHFGMMENEEKGYGYNQQNIPKFLPQRKFVQIKEIREGAARFAFILENSKPGTFPDAPLIAALPELKSTVLSRAVLLLECIHFVHRCNHGGWPDWIRSGMSLPGRLFNSSGSGGVVPQTPLLQAQSSIRIGGGVGASRRTSLMQRALGRAFYAWAFQLGIRLQRQLDLETDMKSTAEIRRLKLIDELEDFLDDGTVNDNNGDKDEKVLGNAFPIALQLMVCMLLQQITSFLRETFQLLPRSRQLSQKANSAISTGLQSNRRWSILSNTFNPQMLQQQQHLDIVSGSVHSINELHPERRISYSTADDENSRRGSHDLIGEEHQQFLQQQQQLLEKTGKVRRLAQGRQRLLKRSSPSSGGIAQQQTPPPSASSVVDSTSSAFSPSNTNRSFRESFRLRKFSKSAHPQTTSTAVEPTEVPETMHGESVSLVRRATTDDDPLIIDKMRQQRIVSFAHRRRRTTSFKSPVTRSLMPRHSMRVGRRIPVEKDNELDEDENIILSNSDEITSTFDQNTTTCTSNQGPTRSPIFMLSMTQKGSRLKPTLDGQQQNQPSSLHSPEHLSSGTAATNSILQKEKQAEEDDEEEMIKNMPWLKTLLAFSQRFGFSCAHENFCSKWCFERIYRQCSRLIEALSVIYGNQSIENRIDRRQQYIERWQNIQHNAQKRHSSNPPRRESANVRQSGVDRMPLALRGLIIEKLMEIEEIKSKKTDEMEAISEPKELRQQKTSPIFEMLRVQLLGLIHSPLSTILKSIVLLKGEQLAPVIPIAWTLLTRLEDSNLIATAAAFFICCAVKCPQECNTLMSYDLASSDPSVRTLAIKRFYVLWRQRFLVWLKLEDGAQLLFKVPPPNIDFTLPSPSIGQNQVPVVDPPWMPPLKTKIEELSLKEEEQSTTQTIMAMTRTRRKQKQEMVRKALRRAEERQRELREQFPLRATAVVQQAAYEPSLFQHQQLLIQPDSSTSGGTIGGDESTIADATLSLPTRQIAIPVAQPLFPSSILSVVPTIVELLDDPQVDNGGVSVGETCRNIIWNCLVEDTSLFLRHFFEKFTNRDKQKQMLALLRRLVLRFRPLPPQTAHTILNALLGLVMFYVRTPGGTIGGNEIIGGNDRSLALALSVCWLIVPYVHGLYFKDLKQTLKKEQCDQAIMITANLPSAKKILVHGLPSDQLQSSGYSGIPAQFPVLEETQFQHLITESLNFFGIEKNNQNKQQYYLYDPKTFILHNPNSYVRDFYFFHRSFYPQLQLLCLNTQTAEQRIREHAFHQKLIETGKVLLTHNALRYSPESVIPQRIFFLHDEFTHLPSFPRKAVESCFGMYQGLWGDELQTMDALHKFSWANLMSNMFEKMENVFMFGDLHLFINVINGVMIIHCEDVLILRRCMTAYLTMSIHFQSLFAIQGFFLIMPTILRCYCQRQPNRLFTQVVEFVCKQFYILHRKPFLLQMFGSVADILDQNDNDLEANPMKVKARYLFTLLLAMEKMLEPMDQLQILNFLPYSTPLQALDLCYKDEPNTFTILTDAMASCVTICAFAPETRRSYQMLLCMQSILPHLLLHMEEESNNSTTSTSTKNGGIGGNNRSHSGVIINNSSSVIKHELAAFATLGVEMRALANSCDILARGPTRSLDFLSTNNNGNAFSNVRECKSRSFLATNERADSPQFFDPPTIIDDEPSKQNQPTTGHSHSSGGLINNNTGKPKLTLSGWIDSGITDIEIHKEQFRGPRDALLTLCAMFIHRGTIRLKELSKLLSSNNGQSSEHSSRIPELLDHRCHSKISEVAVALLKLAPYDAQTLTCNGLQDYFSYFLPIVDWSVETNRSSINVILRRLDKTIVKIAKRPSMRRNSANWEAVSCWLTGLHQTLLHSPHIAHLHSLKTITLLCLRLTLGDTLGPMEEPTGPQQPHISTPVYSHTVLNAHIPPPTFCSVSLKLFTVWAESQRLGHFGAQAFSLDLICTPEAIGPLAERPEALLCQFLIPMFLHAAIPGKASPKFHSKDLHFCLHLLQQAICPPLISKQSVVPMAVSGTSLANSLMRESTGGGGGGICVNTVSGGGFRQGSVSVTEKGGFSATVSTARIVRDSVALAVILAIKAIILSFQKQLTVYHWLRISRIVREMVAKKCGGSTLFNFIEFIICSNSPIAELLQPLMQIRLNQRPANDLDASWQSEMRERLLTFKQLKREEFSIISLNNKQFSTSFNIFNQLQILRKELILLREDFANRSLEIPRSHTPTIGGEIHSDSGSSGTGTRESRRLSSSAALGKLRWIQPTRNAGGDEKNAKKSLSSQQQENNSTIIEMEETTGDDGIDNITTPTTSVQHKVNKSPSLPFNARSSMLRVSGIRRKAPSADSPALSSTGKITNKVEMREVSHELGRRTKSLKNPGGRFAVSMGDESSSITGRNNLTESSTPSQSSLTHGGSTGERPRVVSFSTPRHSSVSETISEADSETEFCITSTKHLI